MKSGIQKAAVLLASIQLVACGENSSTMTLAQDDFPDVASAIDSQFLERNMTAVATLELATEQSYQHLADQNLLKASVLNFDKPISGSDMVLVDISTLANDECMGFDNGEVYELFLDERNAFGKRYAPGNELFTLQADSTYLTDLFLGTEETGPVEQTLGPHISASNLAGKVSGEQFDQFDNVSLPTVDPIKGFELSGFNPLEYIENDISTWPAFTADTIIQWEPGNTTANRIIKMTIIEYDPNATTEAGGSSSGAGRVIACESADDGHFSFSPTLRDWMGNDFNGLLWSVSRQGWNIVRKDSTAVVATHTVTLSEIEVTP